jgi:hypothetical protein
VKDAHIEQTMKTKLFPCLALVLVGGLFLYVAGYFFEVDRQLENPFISWPIVKPLPLQAYYRVGSLRIIYKPAVRLDQKLFPNHWWCQPTPKARYQILPKNFDLNRMPFVSTPSPTGRTVKEP